MNETEVINSNLKIVKLAGERFSVKGGYIVPTGYALKHRTLGFFGFKSEGLPMQCNGGKIALQSILDAGGITDFDNSIWYLPCS